MNKAKRVTATLTLATVMTLFGALPAQAAGRTAVSERASVAASTDEAVLPQAGWRFDSYHTTSLSCNSKGAWLKLINHAEDWKCIHNGQIELHIYAWWF